MIAIILGIVGNAIRTTLNYRASRQARSRRSSSMDRAGHP
jgi:hypothetical protein